METRTTELAFVQRESRNGVPCVILTQAGYENLLAERAGMLEALQGLLANAPKPKRVKDDFSYMLYLEAARTAIRKATGQ